MPPLPVPDPGLPKNKTRPISKSNLKQTGTPEVARWLPRGGRYLAVLVLRTGLPRDVNLLGEGDGGIVVGQFAVGAGVARRERDAVVDVEQAVGAAGRPDDGRGLDLVVLGVDLAIGERAAAAYGHAGCRLFVLVSALPWEPT